MVLGWKDGENSVTKGILDKIASLKSKVKLLESENKALKSETNGRARSSKNKKI